MERLAKLNPNIDPLDEVQGQGIYTGPSLGAVSGSNGGTSTGSWTGNTALTIAKNKDTLNIMSQGDQQ